MKKILLSSLILLICISMLATFSLVGCKTTTTTITTANSQDTSTQKDTKDTSTQKDTNQKVILTLTTISGPNGDRLDAEANAFMEKNPNVEIKVIRYADMQYEEQGPRLFLSKDKPDIAWYWADKWYHKIVESGALVPLDDLYQSEGWDKVLAKATLEQYTSPDGKKYAVNVDVLFASLIFYNKKIFAEIGVEPPKTFQDLYAIGDKLKAKGYIPLVMGVGERFIAGHLFDALLSRSVDNDKFLKLLDRSKKYDDINYTSPEVIDAWKTMKDVNDKLFAKGMVGVKDQEARGLFVQGKAAMYSHISSAAGSSKLGKELPQDFELGTFFYPQLKDNIKPTASIYAGTALMVLKGTGKEDWAKKFVAFVMTHERQAELAKNKMLFPSRTDMKPEEIELMGKVYVDMYKEVQDIGAMLMWDGDIDADLGNTAFQLDQAVMSGQKTPEQAGKELEEKFESMLSENK